MSINPSALRFNPIEPKFNLDTNELQDLLIGENQSRQVGQLKLPSYGLFERFKSIFCCSQKLSDREEKVYVLANGIVRSVEDALKSFNVKEQELERKGHLGDEDFMSLAMETERIEKWANAVKSLEKDLKGSRVEHQHKDTVEGVKALRRNLQDKVASYNYILGEKQAIEQIKKIDHAVTTEGIRGLFNRFASRNEDSGTKLAKLKIHQAKIEEIVDYYYSDEEEVLRTPLSDFLKKVQDKIKTEIEKIGGSDQKERVDVDKTEGERSRIGEEKWQNLNGQIRDVNVAVLGLEAQVTSAVESFNRASSEEKIKMKGQLSGLKFFSSPLAEKKELSLEKRAKKLQEVEIPADATELKRYRVQIRLKIDQNLQKINKCLKEIESLENPVKAEEN